MGLMAYQAFSNCPDMFAGFRLAVIREGGGRWEFDTQEEAHAFMVNAKLYDPEAEFYWKAVK